MLPNIIMGTAVPEDSVCTVLSSVAVSPLDLEHSLAELLYLRTVAD